MSQSQKWTTSRIRGLKGKSKIVALTAYDFAMAQLVDEADLHIILVGDTLGMTMLGYDSTIPVTMDDMLHHTAAVVRGTQKALVVGDMPFLSYQVSDGEAVENAGRLLKEAGADAVKVEGGAIRKNTIRHLVENGIPVMGHIGLVPQNVKAIGGYKVQGKTEEDAQKLVDDAKALEEAGAFAIVIECVPRDLGARITNEVKVPTIGIGAGPDTDGQILVLHDMLGMYNELTPRFVKKYADIGGRIKNAFLTYREDVEDGRFPDDEHCY